jgi:hypothetical protein
MATWVTNRRIEVNRTAAMRRHLLVLFLLAFTQGGFASEVDVIARLTGVPPEVKGEVAKISVPRSDLSVTVDGVKLNPFQGLTSWAAFTGGGDAAVVMGDLTLTEAEVDPVMDAALGAGLEVTALHNHFSFDQPRILFMHVAGTGSTEKLAAGVRKTLDAIDKAGDGGPAAGFGGPSPPSTSTIDPKPLAAILGTEGEARGGMVRFVFPVHTKMHGVVLGGDMGVNTWVAFAGAPDTAVADGDFAMLEPELQPVLRALRAAQIHVVAIHSHMTHEEPRIVFLHFWGKGRAEELARGIQAARATQE